MFQSRRKTKTEWVNPREEWLDWRDASPQVERTGLRLDAVRLTLKKLKPGTWAHTHWSRQEAIMLRKWKMMTVLQRSGLRQNKAKPTYEIDYDWWEPGYEIMSFPVFAAIEGWMDNWFAQDRMQDGLARSWEKARNELVQKARQGLV
jgi:hypothetical protein